MLKDLIHAFDIMLKVTLDLQKKNNNPLDRLSPKECLSTKAWLKEHCTIKFGMPRQSGNTGVIRHYLRKIRNCTVFCPNKKFGEANYWSHEYETFNKILKYPDLYKKQYVFVDNYSFMSKKQEEKLYSSLTDLTKIIALIQ